MSVLDEIAAERKRQIEDLGCSQDHDDTHDDGSLASGAAAYAALASLVDPNDRAEEIADVTDPGSCGLVFGLWPPNWSLDHFKPKDRRRDLIRAAALIVAEIERTDRATLRSVA